MIHESKQSESEPASIYSVIRCQGPEARAFLQAQLSCDLAKLGSNCSVAGALLNPKGKVLTTLVVVQIEPDDLALMVDRTLGDWIQRHLQKFVFRAKVTVSLDPSCSVGVQLDPASDCNYDLSKLLTQWQNSVGTIAWPGGLIKLDLIAGPSSIQPSTWRDEQIRHGLIPFDVDHSDRFVPALLNLDWLNLLSFDKGCYPGQEIVARTRHLGRIKRRLFTVDWLSPQTAATFSGEKWRAVDGRQAETIAASHDGKLALILGPKELMDQPVISDSQCEARLAQVPYQPPLG